MTGTNSIQVQGSSNPTSQPLSRGRRSSTRCDRTACMTSRSGVGSGSAAACIDARILDRTSDRNESRRHRLGLVADLPIFQPSDLSGSREAPCRASKAGFDASGALKVQWRNGDERGGDDDGRRFEETDPR
jgi:hypothetical protein